MKLFSLFDPSEPLFQCGGWHSAIIYRRAHLLFGYPMGVDEVQRQQYRGRHGGQLAKDITQSCWEQIVGLLNQGSY